jgi:hypothetical protein
MAVNTSKVVVGGIASGVVLIVVDFLMNGVVLADRMKVEMNALSPGMADRMMTPANMAVGIATDVVLGIMLVWLYAAIRPRFGPGPRTAMYAAIFMWLMGSLIFYSFVTFGIMTAGTYGMVTIGWLVALMIAGWLGARIYSEGGMTTAPAT